MTTTRSSSNEGGGGGRVVLEGGRNLLLGLIVASKPVDPRLNQDKAELGVLVLAVGLQVLADGDSLLDQVPQVLRDLWCKTFTGCETLRKKATVIWHRLRTLGLQDTEDLVTSDEANLRYAVRVTEGNTDLGWGQALAGELGDVLDDVLRGRLEP